MKTYQMKSENQSFIPSMFLIAGYGYSAVSRELAVLCSLRQNRFQLSISLENC